MVNYSLNQLIWSPYREGDFEQSEAVPLEHKETRSFSINSLIDP